MNFKDVWATDENGNQFVFTVEMQRKLVAQGLDPVPEAVSAIVEEMKEDDLPAPTIDPDTIEAPEPKKQSEEPVQFDEPMTIQIDPETGKYIGRMKWYNAKKGYGFIMRGGGEEIFFHKSGIMGSPEDFKEGQWILYDIEETKKGPEAAEVEPYAGEVDLLS